MRLGALRVDDQDLAPELLRGVVVLRVVSSRAAPEHRPDVLPVDRDDLVQEARRGLEVLRLVVLVGEVLQRDEVVRVGGELLHVGGNHGLVDAGRGVRGCSGCRGGLAAAAQLEGHEAEGKDERGHSRHDPHPLGRDQRAARRSNDVVVGLVHIGGDGPGDRGALADDAVAVRARRHLGDQLGELVVGGLVLRRGRAGSTALVVVPALRGLLGPGHLRSRAGRCGDRRYLGGGFPTGRRCRRPVGTGIQPCRGPDEGGGARERGRVGEEGVRLVRRSGFVAGPSGEVAGRSAEERADLLMGCGDLIGRRVVVEPEARQERGLQLDLVRGSRAGPHGHGRAPPGHDVAAHAWAPVLHIGLPLALVGPAIRSSPGLTPGTIVGSTVGNSHPPAGTFPVYRPDRYGYGHVGGLYRGI